MKRKIDREFLLERCKVHKSIVDEELSVLQQNGILNVAVLSAFSSSKNELRNLKAKNERGESVTLAEETIDLLWRFIEEHRSRPVSKRSCRILAFRTGLLTIDDALVKPKEGA